MTLKLTKTFSIANVCNLRGYCIEFRVILCMSNYLFIGDNSKEFLEIYLRSILFCFSNIYNLNI